MAGVFTGDHPYNIQERVPEDLLALTGSDVQRFFDAHYVPAKVVIAVQGDMDAPTLAVSLAKAAADGFAHPRQRRGDIAEWPAGAIQIQWLSPTPATWFRDPDDPTRPLDPGRPSTVTHPTPPTPTPDTTIRSATHSGTWPSVQVVWYLPPARHLNWFHEQEAGLYANDTLRALYRSKEVVSGGCDSILGTRGSALLCTVSVEREELREGIGRRIANAFKNEPGHTMETRQRLINNSDSRSWQAMVQRDMLGIDELADLSIYRLATGRFDLVSSRAAALTGAFDGWAALRDTWLRPELAVVTWLDPEPRDSSTAAAEALGGGVPTQLIQWPAPELGPASGEEAQTALLDNGLHTVSLPMQGAEVAAWRLAVPSLPGLEHLEPVIDMSLRTPKHFEGSAIRYTWDQDVVTGGTVHIANQQGMWEPWPLLRSLWAAVEAPRVGDVQAALRRFVASYVYAGRSPYTWRWRVWRRATREDPEKDGIAEVDEVIRTPGAVSAYLEARYQPERATLFVVGRLPTKADEQIARELGDWRTDEPPPLELPKARRRPPTPEIVVLDDNNRGRTVSVMWGCPLASGRALDPYTAELASRLASNRLFDIVRASDALTYTPFAFTEHRLGGVDLLLEAPTELGLEGRVLAALRGVAHDLANGASAPLLTAARRQVLAAQLDQASSMFGLAWYLPRGVLLTGSISELHARRAALADVDSADVDAIFRGCDTTGAALLVGPAEEVVRNLSTESLPVRTFDWRAEQLATVGRWAPTMYLREEARLAHAQGK